MVTPVSGGSGTFDTNTPPTLDFKPTDVVRPAATFKFASDPIAANRPRLSAAGAMQIVEEARNADKAEQFKAEAQRGELRKDFYAASADASLSNTQRAQLMIAIGSKQFLIAAQLSGFFNAIKTTVENENLLVGFENAAIINLNNAIITWNNAKAAYESNPTPANLTALQTATNDYDTARIAYESFRASRNPNITTYNGAVQPTQTTLDAPGGINEQMDELNEMRQLLDLPITDPENYELLRDLMAAAAATPDVSNPSNLPPDLEPLTPRTTVNITTTPFGNVVDEFIYLIIAAVNLLAADSAIGKALASQSVDTFDYIFFNLKERLNPTVLEAVIQDQPTMKETEGDSSVAPSSGVGSSAISAALSTTPDNVNLKEAPGQAYYSAEQLNQATPQSPTEVSSIDARLRTDLNGISFNLLRDIKLNAAIRAREVIGPGVSVNNPTLRAVSGLETIQGIQGYLASNNIDELVNGLLSRAFSNNPELAEAVRAPLTAALKLQFQLIAANELAEALGDPAISSQLLLATPGLEQLKTALAGSSTMRLDDLLSGPFSLVYLKVSLADHLSREEDLDSQEAAERASIIVEQLNQNAIKTPEELRRELIRALLDSFSANTASKIVDGILSQIGNDREVLSLNKELVVRAELQEFIANQVTSDVIEKAALLSAFNTNYRTAEELRNNAAEKLTAAAVSSERANYLAEQLGRIALLDSTVSKQMENRLKQLDPDVRKRVENEFLSTITVPQKVKIEEKENRINPLSIPNQIADQIARLEDQGQDHVLNAIIDDAKKAAREDYGDFVQRKRAQDLGRIYLHQTMEAGSPFTGTSALPQSNFAKPAVALPSTQAA